MQPVRAFTLMGARSQVGFVPAIGGGAFTWTTKWQRLQAIWAIVTPPDVILGDLGIDQDDVKRVGQATKYGLVPFAP